MKDLLSKVVGAVSCATIACFPIYLFGCFLAQRLLTFDTASFGVEVFCAFLSVFWFFVFIMMLDDV